MTENKAEKLADFCQQEEISWRELFNLAMEAKKIFAKKEGVPPEELLSTVGKSRELVGI